MKKIFLLALLLGTISIFAQEQTTTTTVDTLNTTLQTQKITQEQVLNAGEMSAIALKNQKENEALKKQSDKDAKRLEEEQKKFEKEQKKFENDKTKSQVLKKISPKAKVN